MSDQTVSAVYSFFLAMTLHPEAQKKAQDELDRVVGPDRLPTFADRPNLPYVDYPEGFQGTQIPVYAPTVVKIIEDRVEGRL